MVFFIYQLGSLPLLRAISNLIKKDVPQRIKNKIIVLLLVTSWIECFGYFSHLKNQQFNKKRCSRSSLLKNKIIVLLAITS